MHAFTPSNISQHHAYHASLLLLSISNILHPNRIPVSLSRSIYFRSITIVYHGPIECAPCITYLLTAPTFDYYISPLALFSFFPPDTKL